MKSLQTYDPYDLWATKYGIKIKQKFYQGQLSGKIYAIIFAFIDWLAPEFARMISNTQPRIYPIVVSFEILRKSTVNKDWSAQFHTLSALIKSSSCKNYNSNSIAWGLGFPWMSKNGFYKSDIPFITQTPYVMEALIILSSYAALKKLSDEMFLNTWEFLQSLNVMHESIDKIALSYAPAQEPRIVVNANAYAAFAYALHYKHGDNKIKHHAKERAGKIVNWVLFQQQDDGSWCYYADHEKGNFIDCFHSCFIIKNLIKVKNFMPELANRIDPAVKAGWMFLQKNFYNEKAGMCRRFVQHDHRDPFRWDLYDQAEYLGLLVDFNLQQQAMEFRERVISRFSKKNDWWCRIDIFGRRRGKNYLRWGIAQFHYHSARLNRLVRDS